MVNVCDYCLASLNKSNTIEIKIERHFINRYCRDCWDSRIRDVIIELQKRYEEANKKYAG